MSLPEENESRGRAMVTDLDHATILSKGCGGDGCEIPLFYDHNLTSEWASAETASANHPIHLQSTLSASGLELTANPVTLPHATWNQFLEPSFPNQLEQMSLVGLPTSEYLRHQLEFLGPCNVSPESLSYDYNQPLIDSSPNCHPSETEPVLPFENHSHVGPTFQPSGSIADFFSKVATGHEMPQYNSLSQEFSLGLTCPSTGSHLAMLSIPQSLDYPNPETCRAPPLIGPRKSLPIIGTGVIQHAPEFKERFPGFEAGGAAIASQDLVVLPNSSKYPPNIEGFLDTAESCSLQPSWDIQTHSCSSSRASSYDQSNTESLRYPEANASNYYSSSTPTLVPSLSSNFFNEKILTPRGSSHEPEKNSLRHASKKQGSPKAAASRPSDHQNNHQRRIGSLIDIHHLTNHVPRRRLTVEQEQILLRRFAVQEYLSKREMEELAEKLKIPTSQLRTWFGNRRSKLKAAARQKAKIEAGMGHL